MRFVVGWLNRFILKVRIADPPSVAWTVVAGQTGKILICRGDEGTGNREQGTGMAAAANISILYEL
jgi:hypothetical protein